MSEKTYYIPNICFTIELNKFRSTPNVGFYIVPEIIRGLSSVDQVRHAPGAVSPYYEGCEGNLPWYMHQAQEDSLLVYQGTRIVELYTPRHGKVEKFEITPDYVKHGTNIVSSVPCVFGWPVDVFHRVQSPNGSISTNFARHFEGFDIRNNFSIYNVDTKTGKYEVIREGFKDQK